MWAPGRPPGPVGWDRRRVGARLCAALAGLRELQGLRERQEAAVRGALAPRPPPGPRPPRAPEALEEALKEALEEALVALQEQLHRLQHQDLSLRAHLAHLDQRVSELQLDVHSTPPDGPDSDSRPSSGFYEMSDGGSCSLSASCTSVCSDRPPCPRGPLLPRGPSARASAGAGRPWSADETTVCRAALPVGGLQATEDGAGPSRPRPVSTGDLERVLPAEAADGAASSVLLRRGLGPLPPGLDPKYQRDLVSKGGGEVYLYPSPLHAVALQSPLFALPAGTPPRDSPPQPPSQPLPGPAAPRPARTWPAPDPGAARAYIDRLLGLRGLGGPPRGRVGRQGPPSRSAETERRPEGLTCSPRGAGVGGGAPRGDPGGNSLEQRGPVPLGSPPPPSSLPEGGRRPPRGCVRAGTVPGSPPPGAAPRAQQAAPAGPEGTARLPSRAGRGPRGHPHSVAGSAAPTGPPAGQSPGPPATKAVRVGRGAGSRAPPLPPTGGAGLGRRPPQAREAPGRSCSERSLFPAAPAAREGAPAAAGRAARPRQRRWRSSVELSARARLPAAPGGGRDGGGRPAWPGGSPPQPPGSPPAPGLRRTKASKALKKKICRFQPTALTVMTLV